MCKQRAHVKAMAKLFLGALGLSLALGKMEENKSEIIQTVCAREFCVKD